MKEDKRKRVKEGWGGGWGGGIDRKRETERKDANCHHILGSTSAFPFIEITHTHRACTHMHSWAAGRRGTVAGNPNWLRQPNWTNQSAAFTEQRARRGTRIRGDRRKEDTLTSPPWYKNVALSHTYHVCSVWDFPLHRVCVCVWRLSPPRDPSSSSCATIHYYTTLRYVQPFYCVCVCVSVHVLHSQKPRSLWERLFVFWSVWVGANGFVGVCWVLWEFKAVLKCVCAYVCV